MTDQAESLRQLVTGPHLVIQCAWRNAHMGYRACAEENRGKVSHGICEICLDRMKEKLIM